MNSSDTIKSVAGTHNCEGKEVHAFPKSINPKVNVIVQLDFKLSNIERPNQLDILFVCLSNTTKRDTIPIYIYN